MVVKCFLSSRVRDPEMDPDPQDPHVFGPPRYPTDPDQLVRGKDPDPDPSLFSSTC